MFSINGIRIIHKLQYKILVLVISHCFGGSSISDIGTAFLKPLPVVGDL